MSSSPPEHLEVAEQNEVSPRRAGKGRQRARPLDLARYLQERGTELSEAWTAEIVARDLGQGTVYDRVVGRFVTRFAGLLPWMVGPHATHVNPLWDRAAELFGAMSAKRGLAAGEVIEEFQILRDLLIRTIFRDPPREGPLSLRDILRLNRIVDSGVTYASVGHTDALFFQYLEAQDAPVQPSPEEIIDEADRQLALIEDELEQIVGDTAPIGAGVMEN
jgi:hypothetical protein